MLAWLGTRKAPDQIVMLGLEGAGKTTLLFKLKLPSWKGIETDIKRMKDDKADPDIGYHYEEFHHPKLKDYGIWDVPGAMTELWPMFYRYIRVTAILFVVDGSPEASVNEEMLAKAKRSLQFLLCEDELRSSAFIVIINERHMHRAAADADGKAGSGEDDDVRRRASARRPSTTYGKTVMQKLNLNKYAEQAWNAARFQYFFLDLLENNKLEWSTIVTEIHKISIMAKQ